MNPPNDEHRTSERLRAALAEFGQIEAAYLFGSTARGTPAPQSDVDVAVLVGRPTAGERRLELIATLQPAVSPRRLDLIVLDDAPTTLAMRVLQDGIVLFGEHSAARLRHRVKVFRDYLDLEPLRRAVRQGVVSRIDENRYGRP